MFCDIIEEEEEEKEEEEEEEKEEEDVEEEGENEKMIYNYENQLEELKKDISALVNLENMILAWESKDCFLNEIDNFTQIVKNEIAPSKSKFLEFSIMIQRIMNAKVKANFSKEFFCHIFDNFQTEIELYFKDLLIDRDYKCFKTNEIFLAEGVSHRINQFCSFATQFHNKTKKRLAMTEPYDAYNPIKLPFNYLENIYYSSSRKTSDQVITEIIIKDDIDGFIRFVSENETFDIFTYSYDSLILEIVNLYKKSYYKIDSRFDNVTLLDYSIYQGSLKIFKYLLMKKTPFTKLNAALFAICGGNIEIIGILENDLGIRYNEECLLWAIKFYNNDVVEYLIETHHIRCTSKAIVQSVKYANYPVLLQLLEDSNCLSTRICTNNDNEALLLKILETKNYDFLKFLVPSPHFDINTHVIKHVKYIGGFKSHYGDTALSWAISIQDIPLIKLILLRPDLKRKQQIYFAETCYHNGSEFISHEECQSLAFKTENKEIINLFLKKWPRLNPKDIAIKTINEDTGDREWIEYSEVIANIKNPEVIQLFRHKKILKNIKNS
ncbi:hypothetical protein TRFO_05845 [Tritrichomonas foetus]|uniref:DUF3447 domain-containing protein n=1 Tax=Tritrichomonas foetus TaxID=1144522 RepID=A0A1J4K4D1_9EUKA|nr:hypothetical protein TRFO_05845 [Tritrichomonas foetus]|eukprot:OHT05696.1 hypothetical protein TRFO_05845 [Tritrichomonas foetus]